MKNILLTFCAVLCAISSFAALGPITGPTTVCAGASITLSNATPGGVWSCFSTSVATIGSSSGILTGATVSTTVSTTVQYTVGSETVYMVVTVNPIPSIWGSPLFCNSMWTDTFTTTIPGGIWSCDTLADDTMSAVGVLWHAPPYGGGIDTVRYVSPAGCAAKMLVTVNPMMAVSVPFTFCIGTPAFAFSSWSPGVWSTSTPSIATITAGGLITGISAGTALFTYSSFGCVMPWYSSMSSLGIAEHSITNSPDTACSAPDFYLSVCGGSSTYNLTTFFGDGTSSSVPLGSASSIHVSHNYSFPGNYTIKQRLYDGSTLLDTIRYSYDYNYCHTLPIRIFNDLNSNCVYNTGEPFSHLPATLEVDSNGVSIDTISAISGLYYRAYGPAGTVYGFRVLSAAAGVTFTCPAGGVLYDTIDMYANSYTPKYFGMSCSSSPGFDLSETATANAGRHAFISRIYFDNASCTPAAPTVKMYMSPKYSFVDAIPAPTSVTGGVVTWDMSSVSSFGTMPPHIYVHLEVPGAWLLPGDTVHTSYLISPTSGDINPGNNGTNRCDTVKASFDPNDISVTPQGYIPSAATQLKYTIRFQNTGNDTATNIYIMDTLPAYVDVNSLRLVAASHVMNIAMVSQGGMNIVKFDFPNINLPDSSHHGFCDGMVTYNINTIAGLAPGTIIPHRVGIYFDDNEVVMTNTVNNIIETPITPPPTMGINTIANSPIKLYPNPASGEMTIETGEGDYNTYTVANSIGQVLMQQSLSGTYTRVSVKALPPALYYITLSGANGSTVKKFVKE